MTLEEGDLKLLASLNYCPYMFVACDLVPTYI